MRADPGERSLCFGAVAYANAVPLAHFIPEVCPGALVWKDVPSALMSRLLRGECDAALVPVADFFAHPELAYVDGLGICAEERVQSVLLKCRRPLEQVRSVALDPASRTSNVLAAVLLRRHCRLSVEMRLPAPGTVADAEVVIGDRALCAPPGPAGDYDLAELWHAMTGLPFVFAVWAYRREDPRAREFSDILHAARRLGGEAIDELARSEARRLGLPLERCRDYYARAIRYDLGPREAEGMRCFRVLWEECANASPAQPSGHLFESRENRP
jgi:chorismate dehydratase